jgi:hypothetical protein
MTAGEYWVQRGYRYPGGPDGLITAAFLKAWDGGW